MKIAIASLGNPMSVSTWSGIPLHLILALKKRGHDVSNITLNIPQEPWYYDWYRRLYYKLKRKWFLSAVEPYVLKQIAKQFDVKVEECQPDIVIVIHGDFLSNTSFTKPAVIVHDATFASLLEYYPAFSNLTQRSVLAGNKMYQLALDKAKAAIYSSEWASQSAKSDYTTHPEKIYTIPFGANLNVIPTADNVLSWIKKRLLEKTCNFLFLGVDWERKGGPDALRFVVELNRIGIDARLWVAGCYPEILEKDKKYVLNMGFLRKDIKEEAEILENLFINSHALLLPSIAECYGCVYCEANAYGLPAIGRDTGGVSEIIKNNVNGILLQSNETPELLSVRWATIWSNKKAYEKIATTSYETYHNRLNYDVSVEKIESILKSLIKN